MWGGGAQLSLSLFFAVAGQGQVPGTSSVLLDDSYMGHCPSRQHVAERAIQKMILVWDKKAPFSVSFASVKDAAPGIANIVSGSLGKHRLRERQA